MMIEKYFKNSFPSQSWHAVSQNKNHIKNVDKNFEISTHFQSFGLEGTSTVLRARKLFFFIFSFRKKERKRKIKRNRLDTAILNEIKKSQGSSTRHTALGNRKIRGAMNG